MMLLDVSNCMKKFLGCLVLFLSSSLFTPVLSQVKFGPLIGVNVSRFNYTSDNSLIELRDISSVAMMKLGAIVRYEPTTKISLQSGLCYSGMGSDFYLYNRGYATKSTIISTRLNYLSVPVELHYTAFDKAAKISGMAGLDFNVLAFATTNNEGDKSYRKFDPALRFGSQIMFPIGLGLRFDYSLGLSPAINNFGRYGEYNLEFKNKNRVLGISVLWLFGGTGVI